jgi:predicted nucleic acid-binding protein
VKFLVDSDVLSELTKPSPAQRVIDWLRIHDHDIVVNPIIVAELQYGILLFPAGRRRTKLLEWYQAGIVRLEVINIDAETATVWAELLADLKQQGRVMPVKDSLIAATAKQHGLSIATGNASDFLHAGVQIVNPFANP